MLARTGTHLLSIIFLLGTVSSGMCADYDLDGQDELEVATVRRSGTGGGGSTSWVVRHSSTGKAKSFRFSKAGDALVRFRRADGKQYPGIVYVQDLSTPLQWIVKTATGEERFSYGSPGDGVPNQGDLDADGVTDPTVIVEQTDGSLLWVSKLSSQGGADVTTTLGVSGNRNFIGADGMLLSVSPAFLWSGKRITDSAVTLSQSWGEPGDVPMAPSVSGQLLVSRIKGRHRVVLVRNSDGSTAELRVGGKSSVVTNGMFYSAGIGYGAHDRSAKRVNLIDPVSGGGKAVKFGDSSSAIILPSGQVIQKGESGRFGSPGGNGGDVPSGDLTAVCPVIREVARGEIWKAIASTHIPTTDPRRFSSSFITESGVSAPTTGQCLAVYNGNGALTHQLGQYFPTGARYSARYYGGFGCGDKKRAVDIADAARAATGSTSVYAKVSAGVCVRIPNPASCVNSSQC